MVGAIDYDKVLITDNLCKFFSLKSKFDTSVWMQSHTLKFKENWCTKFDLQKFKIFEPFDQSIN